MSSYFGSKATSGLCQAIIGLMPPHDTYIETHLGGGAILNRKPAAPTNIGIELNARTLEKFKAPYPVKLIHGCAHQFMLDYQFTGRELIYCDPPYLHSERTSDRRYRFEYSKQDHIELLEILKTLPCQIILSGYPSELYDDLLCNWHSREIQVMNHSGVRTEKLWLNFTPDKTYWASYAGKNFTDRQRIKRKAASWARRYQAMPANERLAVFAAMMAVEDNESSNDA